MSEAQTKTETLYQVNEIVKRKYNEITRLVEEHVKKSAVDAVTIFDDEIEALAKIKLSLISNSYAYDNTYREMTVINTMGFSIDEIQIYITRIYGRRIYGEITLPNTRVYKIIIELKELQDLHKDIYVKYLEEYNKIRKEIEALVEAEKKRREEEEIKRKLQEYEKLKNENEELKKKILELTEKLDKCTCEEEDSEED